MKLSSVFVNSMWMGKINHAELLIAVCALSPEAQLALYMKYWDRVPNPKIAKKLRMTDQQVEAVLGESLRLLKDRLGEDKAKLLTFAA